MTVRVSGQFDATEGTFVTDWAFLDSAGHPLTGRAAQPGTLGKLLQVTPFFLLSAQRDASRDFSLRAPLWGSFVRDTGIPAEVRTEVESTLNDLNSRLLDSHAPLQSVQVHLAKVPGAVAAGTGDVVAIEPLPGRVVDLLARTQVTVTTPTDRLFVFVDDPLPAGFRALNFGLQTTDQSLREFIKGETPFVYSEYKDDRVVFFADYVEKGTHTVSYLVSAEHSGAFNLPPTFSAEMYTPEVFGQTGAAVVNVK